MAENYDILIIGSGPAGIAAAIKCINHGMKVAIITKSKIEQNARVLNSAIRPTQSIHPGLSSLLEKINSALAIEFSSRATYEGINNGSIFSPLGADENGPWKGNHIDRKLFDQKLSASAKEQGVVFIYNQTVSDIIQDKNRITGIKTKTGEVFYAAYIIDASGSQRIAGKKLVFRERYYSPHFVVWTGVVQQLSRGVLKENSAHFNSSEKGWTWLAPEPGGYCTWTRLAQKGENHFLLPKELHDAIPCSQTVVSNRRWRIFRPLCTEGIVLCGDAAGIVDPAAGQGILNALWSGIRAADTVAACIKQPSFENLHLIQYDTWFLETYEEKAALLRQHYLNLGMTLFD